MEFPRSRWRALHFRWGRPLPAERTLGKGPPAPRAESVRCSSGSDLVLQSSTYHPVPETCRRIGYKGFWCDTIAAAEVRPHPRSWLNKKETGAGGDLSART